MRAILLLMILAASLGLRAAYITASSFWVDEAESAINALSILERGYPADEYLGIPVFENMLVRAWPDHPEYEFKDISYSDRGMAVYHAWLPLYAIAGSFRLFGVDPAKPGWGWRILATEEEMKRRTLAARLPSLVFTAAFLALMFLAGRLLAGGDAGLCAVVLAGLSVSMVELTLYARYYSLMLALSAAGIVTLWQVLSHGRRRDYAMHAGVLILLFYTHMIAFANLVALTTVMLVLFRSDGRAALRWGVSLAAVGLAGLPWLLATGYLEHLAYMPPGHPLLRMPGDLMAYVFSRRWGYQALIWVGVSWLALAWVRHGAALPHRLREPWRRHGRQYVLLLAWLGIVTGTYFVVTPASSLFPERLSLALAAPGFLFMAMTLTDAAKTIVKPLPVIAAPTLGLAFLAASDLLGEPMHDTRAFEKLTATYEAIGALGLRPDAKVYAAPGSHLVLTVYSDKPIQSLAPVRKSFLDSYPGEIVHLEQQFGWQFAAPTAEEIRAAAGRLGVRLEAGEAEALREALATRYARERTAPLVAEVVPPLEALSDVAEEAMKATRRAAEEGADQEEKAWAARRYPFARGFRIRAAEDLWQTFYYRLADPASRSGRNLNAADRLRNSRAYFLAEAGRVLYYAPYSTALGGLHGASAP